MERAESTEGYSRRREISENMRYTKTCNFESSLEKLEKRRMRYLCNREKQKKKIILTFLTLISKVLIF